MIYNTKSPSAEQGWVLVTVVLLFLVIQAMAIAAITVARYNMATSGSFYNILQNTDSALAAMNTGAEVTLQAPEGWDHAVFSTIITPSGSTATQQAQSYSWRVGLKMQPFDAHQQVRLSTINAHFLFILDDSASFMKANAASSLSYDSNAVYVEDSTGRISLSTYELGADSNYNDGAGNEYYTGTYGNGYKGKMPYATKYFALAEELLDYLDLCPITLTTTSSTSTPTFSRDFAAQKADIHGVTPISDDYSPIAYRLYRMHGVFPEGCADSNKHIIMVTDGVSMNDGISKWLIPLPAEIIDFDKDGNPKDTFLTTGRDYHGLDDVAKYYASIGIKVHTMGPDPTWNSYYPCMVRSVAGSASGSYMGTLPSQESIFPETPFTTQIPVLKNNEGWLFLDNSYGHLAPSWIDASAAQWYRPNFLGDTLRASTTTTRIAGVAAQVVKDGDMLYCSTTRDYLLGYNLATKKLDWVIKGMGGKLVCRNYTDVENKTTYTCLIAGPNIYGEFYCLKLNPAPEIIWPHKTPAANVLDASQAHVYWAEDARIKMRDLGGYPLETSYDASSAITALVHDPISGLLYAGTQTGQLIFLNPATLQQIQTIDLFSVDGRAEAVKDIRAFTWRKKLYVVAMTDNYILGATTGGRQWSAQLPSKAQKALIMNGKAYVTSWQEDVSCNSGGFDTGSSSLTVYDALSGAKDSSLSQSSILPGKALGPLLDITGASKNLIFTNTAKQLYSVDISSLPGVKPVSLGTQLTN